MSENITGVIEKIEIQGPFEGKNGKPDYDRHLFTVAGIKLTKLANVGTEPEFQEGDNVHAFFKQTVNGKFTNNYIIKLEKSAEQTKSITTKKVVTDGAPPFKAAVLSSTTTTIMPTSKDISMEVSGLLQALINTGRFLNEDGSGNYIRSLETTLRDVLTLKRKVAKELEEKGEV